jgi:cyanophycinase
VTDQRRPRSAPGAIVLVGSGEYLEEMNATDAYLLEQVGGANDARVVLLPTASGLEDHGPAYWNGLGKHHFHTLGVREVRATSIIDRASAADPAQLALLRNADFYYFSGGDPQHVIETLRDSPAWEIIKTAHEQGAVLAGSSAGAMALSGYTISVRQVLAGGKPTWIESLGLLPQLVVFPHFDRMANFVDQTLFQELLSTLPPGVVAVGIDENTALVRIEALASDEPHAKARWHVMGQQTVKLFERGMAPRILQPGTEVMI